MPELRPRSHPGLDQGPLTYTKQPYTDRLILTVFLVCLVWSLWTAGVGWTNSLSDSHGFRQAQTAITSYYLLRGGPFLNYETPVVGSPWSIPFEFPLYQWVVAAAAGVLKSPLVQTGRFTSEWFFWLSLLPLWMILAELRVRHVYRFVFLTLLIVSPEYVFWSRAFLIESTAFCFGMAYLFFLSRYIRTRNIMDALLGGAMGVVVALVKAPTLPGFGLVAVCLYLLTLRLSSGSHLKALISGGIAAGAFGGLPIVCASLWTQHADRVKALNTIGAHMTSAGLKDFTFGALSLRLSPDTWAIFFGRTIPDLIGTTGILLLPAVALFLSRRRVLPVLVCACGFVGVFLAFTSIHLIHNYYTYANGVFLVAAVSWCIVGALESGGWRRAVGLAVFLLCVGNSIHGYYIRYHDIQKTNADGQPRVAYAVEGMTSPQDVIVVFGQDWSSELPFYSHRRALMWPQWMPQDMDSPAMKEATGRLAGSRIGALIVCDRARRNSRLLESARRALEFGAAPEYQDGKCAIYRTSQVATK